MNSLTIIFFFHNVIATLLLGGKFSSRQDPVLKNFGIALILNSIAFLIWSIAVATNPANLDAYVTWGVVFFIISLLMFLRAGTQNMSASNRKGLMIIGGIVALAVLYVRAFVYPSDPTLTDGGLFFFNPHPIVQIIYIFGLALTAFPAIDAVANRLQPGYAALFRYGFIAEVVGGIILITATNAGTANSTALFITGWIIGLVYILLWTTFLFTKKAWPNNA